MADKALPGRRRGFLKALGGVAASVALGQKSKAGYMSDFNFTNNYAGHLAKGAEYAGSVFAFGTPGWFFGSSTLVGPRSLLITKHQLNLARAEITSDTEMRIFTGPNYKNDRGEIIYFTGVEAHPSEDLVMATLDRDVPGGVPLELVTAMPAEGTVVELAGFGKPGTPNLGILPSTGDRIGGNAKFDRVNSFGDVTTEFSASSSTPLIFNGTTGHSGGAIAFPNGNTRTLIGLVKQGLLSGSFASTIGVNIPTYRTWISERILLPEPTPPEPTVAVVDGQFCLTIPLPVVLQGGRFVVEQSPEMRDGTWTGAFPFDAQGVCRMAMNESKGYFRVKFLKD